MFARPLILALLAVIVVVAGAGCGGGSPASPEDYAEAVVLNRDRVDFALARITRSPSIEELYNRMEEASIVLDKAAGELEDEGAPEKYQPEAGNLVKQLRQLSVDIESTVEQAQQPGFEGLITDPHLQGLSFESWTNMNKAFAGLARKGINVAIVQVKPGE